MKMKGSREYKHYLKMKRPSCDPFNMTRQYFIYFIQWHWVVQRDTHFISSLSFIVSFIIVLWCWLGDREGRAA